jgi:murein DD-endopeptidase MepM/ murein hydrolase activator NlpD
MTMERSRPREKFGFAGVAAFLLLASACLGPPGSRPARPPVARPRAETPAPSKGVFRSPLPGAKVLSRFGRRGRRHHDGIDIRLSRRGGEPVLAAAAGRVAEAGSHRGYGRMVLIEHADGWYTRYAHLRAFDVKEGQWVEGGQKVGRVGRTGRASGPHLHFEVLTPRRRPVDPAPYIFQ